MLNNIDITDDAQTAELSDDDLLKLAQARLVAQCGELVTERPGEFPEIEQTLRIGGEVARRLVLKMILRGLTDGLADEDVAGSE